MRRLLVLAVAVGVRAFAPEHFGLVFSAHAEIEKVRTRPGPAVSAMKLGPQDVQITFSD